MTSLEAGRTNQKLRTRTAIVEAARTLLTGDAEVTMPAVASAALVSEATAYRYFPDLASLLREALTDVWITPAQALTATAANADPLERIGYATEVLFREVLAYSSAVRAVISAAITKPEGAAIRPGRRFGLIDHALAPLEASLGAGRAGDLEQLKRSLAVVISAEALFTLTDLCGLDPEAAIASAVQTARTLTAAVLNGG